MKTNKTDLRSYGINPDKGRKEEAQLHLFKYIEDWYNIRRLHSSIGYQTPDEVYQNG